MEGLCPSCRLHSSCRVLTYLSSSARRLGPQLSHVSLHQQDKFLRMLSARSGTELLPLAAGLGKWQACRPCRQQQWGIRTQSADLRQESARQRFSKPQVHELQAAALPGGELLSLCKALHAMALQLHAQIHLGGQRLWITRKAACAACDLQ